ncbi:hypothetical protein PHMEG_00012716 [Phytophthora megakarya]|uniref:DDE-1 domain-containing protein n=1 Tax=Phytophthora megakarya TaxID=4795 RepID=A0A225WAN0_9STRA|nr:hypothetical protein PHMEG_00012716 [Phytophthora megakarya]
MASCVDGCKLLMLNSLKVHKMQDIKDDFEKECHMHVMYILPGITGLSQPMDVTGMPSFKSIIEYVPQYWQLLIFLKNRLNAHYSVGNSTLLITSTALFQRRLQSVKHDVEDSCEGVVFILPKTIMEGFNALTCSLLAPATLVGDSARFHWIHRIIKHPCASVTLTSSMVLCGVY